MIPLPLSPTDPIHRIEAGGRVGIIASGRLHVVAIQGSARGVLRLGGENMTWVVAAENLMGLAFDPTGGMVLAPPRTRSSASPLRPPRGRAGTLDVEGPGGASCSARRRGTSASRLERRASSG